MRVLVCGGRAYSDSAKVFATLDKLHAEKKITCIIEGGASGADRLAGEWAKKNGVKLEVYRAEWQRFGLKAGPLRNKRMLVEGMPDLVVAFPGGHGTANMMLAAGEAGISVKIMAPEEWTK
jgi:hypothetical protein